MEATTAAPPITVEEYLSNPAYEHCEYIAGEVREIHVGDISHGEVPANIGALLREYLKAHRNGFSGVEVRSLIRRGGQDRFYLPDVYLTLGPKPAGTRFLERAPELAIEVRSPDDTLTEMRRKMADYFANGSKLGWIVLPADSTVIVLKPDCSLDMKGPGETLDGGGVIPELNIAVDGIFESFGQPS